MKSFIRVSALLLSGACAATSAHAEMFNGASIGVQAGVETNKIDSAALLVESGAGPASVDKKSKTAGSVALTLDYDARVFTNFVVGAELAASYSTGTNRQIATLASAPTVPFNIDYKSRYTLEATGRVGVVVAEKALIYLRAGYANSNLRVTTTVPGLGVTSDTGGNGGWLIGGGIDYALTRNLSARVEYRYFDFKGPITRQQAVVGVGYHF
jgi:outer membrane immunogenic protein